MWGVARRPIGSFRKQLVPAVILSLFMAPSAANAELILQLHDVWSDSPVPGISRQTVKRSVNFCLDSNGDLMLRHRDISLTIAAYVPPLVSIEPQERLRISQRQDCPAISGISLKVSLQF